MMKNEIRVSEIFSSFQGEGAFAGMPSLWVRLFGCNLECNGFGQTDPMNPETYVLPWKTSSLEGINKMEDLPVFDKGCDSSYSWAARFKHLALNLTADEIVDRLERLGKEALGIHLKTHPSPSLDFNGWRHPDTKTTTQLCFTGGEPMLQQDAIFRIGEVLFQRNSSPLQITIETNATKLIKHVDLKLQTHHLHMSCSPKLYSVSGEKKAVNLDVISQYIDIADSGCLKFVHNGSKDAWLEMDWIVDELSPLVEGTEWGFWIMPVGSTLETQTPDHIGAIATEALKRGFNVSMRSHIQAYGNLIGY
jgi:organic radical activating enzyme